MLVRHVQNFKILFLASNVRRMLRVRDVNVLRKFHRITIQKRTQAPKFKKYISNSIGAFLALCGFVVARYSGSKDRNIVPKISAEEIFSSRDKFNFIADVARVVSPSIVFVEIRDTRRFNHVTGQYVPISGGSGFIVKSDGLILTNAHVILQKLAKDHLMKVAVKLMDGRVYNAEVESVDKDLDLATLRIPVKDLPTIQLGESESLKQGEFVLALGCPLALLNTVTFGIVSAHRKSEEIGMKPKNVTVYIQTDAAIHNGNSGGPLMNVEGEAVGINTMNIMPGISFATPIDLANKFLADNSDEQHRMHIKQDVEKIRYIGVLMLTLTSHILGDLKLTDLDISPKVSHGVLIQNVIPESPAEV